MEEYCTLYNYKNGQSVEELKQAFITTDDIYLIVDNELLQGACIKIEYKIKVKNEALQPCEKLVIEDELDEGLVCQSEEWEKEGGNHFKFTKQGSAENPALAPEEEFKIFLEATRLLTFNTDQFEFKNKAKAIAEYANESRETLEVEAQTVKVIPPFGTMKKENILKIIGLISIIGIGSFIVQGKVKKK